MIAIHHQALSNTPPQSQLKTTSTASDSALTVQDVQAASDTQDIQAVQIAAGTSTPSAPHMASLTATPSVTANAKASELQAAASSQALPVPQDPLGATAWLGTYDQPLDLSLFPEPLQPALRQIKMQAHNPESALLQSVLLIHAYQQASFKPKMLDLQDKMSLKTKEDPSALDKVTTIETQSSKPRTATTEAKLQAATGKSVRASADHTKDKLEAQTQTEADVKSKTAGATKISAILGEKAALGEVAAQAPIRLLSKTLEHTEFLPSKVCELILSLFDKKARPILYWILRKLGDCPLVLAPEYIVGFASNPEYPDQERYELLCDNEFLLPGLDSCEIAYSDFMFQELMLRFGGRLFQLEVPWALSKTLKFALKHSPDVWKTAQDTTMPGETPSQVEHTAAPDLPTFPGFAWDYVAIFAACRQVQKISYLESIFQKLRFEDPATSRQVLAQNLYQLPEAYRFIFKLFINLSLDDEELLMQIFEGKLRSHPALFLANRKAAYQVLCFLPGSSLSRRSGKMCRKLLRYSDSQGWSVTPLEFTPELITSLKALGLRALPKISSRKAAQNSAWTAGVVLQLLRMMDLDEILQLIPNLELPYALQALLELSQNPELQEGLELLKKHAKDPYDDPQTICAWYAVSAEDESAGSVTATADAAYANATPLDARATKKAHTNQADAALKQGDASLLAQDSSEADLSYSEDDPQAQEFVKKADINLECDDMWLIHKIQDCRDSRVAEAFLNLPIKYLEPYEEMFALLYLLEPDKRLATFQRLGHDFNAAQSTTSDEPMSTLTTPANDSTAAQICEFDGDLLHSPQALKSVLNRSLRFTCVPSAHWWCTLESSAFRYEFAAMQDASLALAMLQQVHLSFVYYDQAEHYNGENALANGFAMYLPYSAIPWLESEIEWFKGLIQNASKPSNLSEFKLTDGAKTRLNRHIRLLLRILKYLKLKQKADQLIKQQLPQYYIEDSQLSKRHSPQLKQLQAKLNRRVAWLTPN